MLPLDDRTIELFGARFRDGSPHRADRHYTYRPPMSPMPAQVGAQIGGRSWDLDGHASTAPPARTACSTPPAPRTRASACSSRATGWCSTTTSSATHHVVESDRPVPSGASTVGVRFRRTVSGEQGRARDPRDRRRADAARLDVPFVMNIISSIGPSVGHDHGSPVSDRYTDAFPFEGTLHQVDIQLLTAASRPRPRPTASDERAEMGRQ